MKMFENVDGRTMDAGVTGILIAHLGAFGSGELKKTIFFDIKCHDSYLMKCLHNSITQNDTIW